MDEGTTTTPFDMVVLNRLDRVHLAELAIEPIPRLSTIAGPAKQAVRDRLIDHKYYIRPHGQDMPEIRAWQWPYK